MEDNQSTKINLIGCDTIVNSPSLVYYQWTGLDQIISQLSSNFCILKKFDILNCLVHHHKRYMSQSLAVKSVIGDIVQVAP